MNINFNYFRNKHNVNLVKDFVPEDRLNCYKYECLMCDNNVDDVHDNRMDVFDVMNSV